MFSLGRLLNVRPGEGGPVAALFVLSLALGLGLAAIEIAVDTELLAGTTPSALPWAHIAVSVAVFLGGALLAGLRAWLPAAAFLGGPLGVIGLAALLCVPLIDEAPGGVTLLALYAGHHVLVAFAVVAFWSLAARALDVEQSRRLYGLVSAGELVAVLLVGLAAAPLQRALELPALLGWALALLVASALTMLAWARRVAVDGPADRVVAAPSEVAASPAERRHITRLVAYYCGYNVTYHLIEFTLFVAVQGAHPGQPEAIAGTLGALAIARIGLGVVVRLFLTGRLLARVGVGVGLVSTPVVVLGVAGLALGLSPLAAAIALSTSESATRSGLGKPAVMAAQRPLSAAPRERVLIAVETFVEPATTGLAGACLLMLPATWLSGPALLFIPTPIAALWLLAARALARSYRRLT